MATYTCVDGPLEGCSFTWRRPPPPSRATTVALLDVGHGVVPVAYRLEVPPDGSRSGSLLFVGAHEGVRRTAWRRRAVPLLH